MGSTYASIPVLTLKEARATSRPPSLRNTQCCKSLEQAFHHCDPGDSFAASTTGTSSGSADAVATGVASSKGGVSAGSPREDAAAGVEGGRVLPEGLTAEGPPAAATLAACNAPSAAADFALARAKAFVALATSCAAGSRSSALSRALGALVSVSSAKP